MNDADTPDLTVSAVICTRNRPDKIGTAVETVLANDHLDFDLTVIDQSTDTQTKEIVERIASTSARSVRHVPMDESGLSKAYNRAISETSSGLLAFTDDDCIAPKEWVSSIVGAFASAPDADLLYGQVLAAYPEDDGVALTPFLEIEQRERLAKGVGFRIFGMGANFAARRRLFDRIGGFDEILGGGGPLKSSQDFDLAYRTFKAGSTILLEPDVVIRHDGRREAEDWPALLTNYGFGDGAFHTKHVRCLDAYATWLFARRFGTAIAKHVAKRALRRPTQSHYLKGAWSGLRGSFAFDVDRDTSLYVPKGDDRPPGLMPGELGVGVSEVER